MPASIVVAALKEGYLKALERFGRSKTSHDYVVQLAIYRLGQEEPAPTDIPAGDDLLLDASFRDGTVEAHPELSGHGLTDAVVQGDTAEEQGHVIAAETSSADAGALEDLADASTEYLEQIAQCFVCDQERNEALAKYTDRLADQPNIGEEWLKAAIAHKAYFRPGKGELGILTAGYFAVYGYHANFEAAARLRANYPDLAWDRLEQLAPKCLLSGVDLRAAVMPEITDPTERILAKILFDWAGARPWSEESIDSDFTFLRQASAMAVGLPKERLSKMVQSLFDWCDRQEPVETCYGTIGSTAEARDERKQQDALMDQMRVAIVQQAFGNELRAVPYRELVRLRQRVAGLVRTRINAEIER